MNHIIRSIYSRILVHGWIIKQIGNVIEIKSPTTGNVFGYRITDHGILPTGFWRYKNGKVCM